MAEKFYRRDAETQRAQRRQKQETRRHEEKKRNTKDRKLGFSPSCSFVSFVSSCLLSVSSLRSLHLCGETEFESVQLAVAGMRTWTLRPWNSTTPSFRAKSVSSLPWPTLKPGRNWVPRWRRMI